MPLQVFSTESSPFPAALRNMARPRLDLVDHAVGVAVGVAGTLAIDAWARASGAGALAPVVVVAAYASIGGLGMQASLAVRAWRMRRREKQRRAGGLDLSPPLDNLNHYRPASDLVAARLSESFGMPFPKGEAFECLDDEVTALGSKAEIRKIVLPLQGWRPWALTVATPEPERTRCTAHFEGTNDRGLFIENHTSGQVDSFPVVGATFGQPSERSIPLRAPRSGKPDKLVVSVVVPPHAVVRVRAYLTRRPGRHPDVEWQEEKQGGGEAA